MTKNALAALALAAVAAVFWAIQCWLERRRYDRAELVLISTFAGSLIVLAIALLVYFGRFV